MTAPESIILYFCGFWREREHSGRRCCFLERSTKTEGKAEVEEGRRGKASYAETQRNIISFLT
ncbi:unnamed protein product [Allacma fusca]|uniref:Uncharacterized protein n=1 Tax=Allacma fusca TaxID=39272 RepID=A0A8J2PFV2_9HEXA|nr:unnamed protein product [Allacma fusca]